MADKFDWIPFHEELAHRLLAYKEKRNMLFELIKKIADQNPKLSYLHFENDEWWRVRHYEIDPFSIYAMFNRKLTFENRQEIIRSLATAFGIQAKVPTDFAGVALADNRRAFYGGNDEVWALFESAITCADQKAFTSKFETDFENAINAEGNGLATVTMGLFWIRPNTYLSLDRQMRELLMDPQNELKCITEGITNSIGKHIPSGKEYIAMTQKLHELLASEPFAFDTIAQMSDYAWINRPERTGEEEATEASKASFLKWFAPLIQALKDLGGSATTKEAIDQIAKNEHLDEATRNETRGKTKHKKFDNEVHWVRNYLVCAGIIDKSQRGIWTLTDEGAKIIMTDELATKISHKQWSVQSDETMESIPKKRYWIYAAGPNASKWAECYNEGIMVIGWDDLGDLEQYSAKKEVKEEMQSRYGDEKTYMNDSLAVWQFTNEMQIGDIVYVKKGLHGIVGRGMVTSDYLYDEMRSEYQHIRKVDWTHKGLFTSPHQSAQKTLTDITQYTDYVKTLEALFLTDEEAMVEEIVTYPPYTKEHFLSEVYLDGESYETLATLLKRKKNIILQGAPGVGKTFMAKRLAYAMMGEKDETRVEMIQFHQSYSYEDFIMGFRPDGNGFKPVQGAFYQFCKKAQDDNERRYFFLIDEINRGHLSKIFGELFMLIEHDKRNENHSIRLLYADEQFYIPANVHIIGMMNTADRSLAMLDYALRRRFAFFEIAPAFDREGFQKYQEKMASDKLDRLIEVVKALNQSINEDASLGGGFRIGHSYFIKGADDGTDDAWLSMVVRYEIIPLLQEYWFDEQSKVKEWTNRLQEAIL